MGECFRTKAWCTGLRHILPQVSKACVRLCLMNTQLTASGPRALHVVGCATTACHSKIAIAPFDECARPHHQQRCCHSSCDAKEMTAVGFEPTPFRTGALSQRLRPLGQTVLGLHLLVHIAVPSDHRMHSARRAEHKLRTACNSCFHVGRACA